MENVENTVGVLKQKRKKLNVLQVILLICLILYTLILATLFVWAIITSLKDSREFRLNTYKWPNKASINNYINAFSEFSIKVKTGRRVSMLEMYWNSALYCFGTAFLGTLIPCITAYCCSKFKYFLSKVVSTVVVITMIIPVVGAEPAAINMARTFGFYDKIWGLWAMAATFCGMYFLVFEAVFNSFPNDYAEAAEIDGASNFTIMVRIIFPLVRNTFATVMLILFIQRWNDYSAPAIYLPTHPTIANGVFLFASSLDAAKSPVTMKVTGAMLVFIPMLIVFAVFNGRLMGNLTMGGIKG